MSESRQTQYEKFRQYFLREAQTIYQFRGHPNIVEVRHLFRENNTAYYVMEYIEGMDLADHLKKQGGVLDWTTLRPIVAQVVSALKLVHSANMIHCDVSPSNIFLTNTGVVKLLDFGAARNTLRGSMEVSVIVANMGYAPWEQLQGRYLGPWTDVYGICAAIYYCLTGKLPPQPMDRLTGTPFPTPSELGVEIPGWQEQAILDGLDLYVQNRIQNMEELWQRLYVSPETEQSTQLPEHTIVSSGLDIPDSEDRSSAGGEPLTDMEKLVLTGMQRIRSICAEVFRKLKER